MTQTCELPDFVIPAIKKIGFNFTKHGGCVQYKFRQNSRSVCLLEAHHQDGLHSVNSVTIQKSRRENPHWIVMYSVNYKIPGVFKIEQRTSIFPTSDLPESMNEAMTNWIDSQKEILIRNHYITAHEKIQRIQRNIDTVLSIRAEFTQCNGE